MASPLHGFEDVFMQELAHQTIVATPELGRRARGQRPVVGIHNVAAKQAGDCHGSVEIRNTKQEQPGGDQHVLEEKRISRPIDLTQHAQRPQRGDNAKHAEDQIPQVS